MKGSWLRVVLAGLCLGAAIGLVAAAGSAAAPHAKPAARERSERPLGNRDGRSDKDIVTAAGDVEPETWMHDLAVHLWHRKLTHIVIPGSHDTATYALTGINWSYAGTQNQTETITAALNQGIREFDIRVKCQEGDCWGYHGASVTGLRLGQIFDQVRDWTLAPGHEHEIILLNLAISTDNGPFPSKTCQDFTKELGGALLTPNELRARFGTADPGQVRLYQLWSMPGHPRVIMDQAQCMNAGDPSAGQWSPTTLFGSYYANQCYADPYRAILSRFTSSERPGITKQVLQAVKSRAGVGGGDNSWGDPVKVGPPVVGGLYVLFIQATTTADCLSPLRWFDLNADRQALGALYGQWQSDPATQANLNVVSGDFVEETDLVTDSIAMNERWPALPDTLTLLGFPQVAAERGQDFLPLMARVTYEGEPAPGAKVTYRVSPSDGPNGPNIDGASRGTAVADQNGYVNLDISAGPRAGTWTLTASTLGAKQDATWTLVVAPSSIHVVQPVAGNPTSLQVGSRVPEGFAVRVFSESGSPPVAQPAPGLRVTFDAASAGGTFPGGAKTATVTTDQDGVARSPAFTAGTRAVQAGGIAAGLPGANEVWLPLAVRAGSPASFVPTSGDLQSTAVNTTFPVALTGHYLDQYGNVVANLDPRYLNFATGADEATWPNGTNVTTVTPAADGTITLPALRAGRAVLNGTRVCYDTACVYPGPFTPVRGNGWVLRITPGPPDAVTATDGDGQQAGKGQRFARRLAARVSDAEGNPIAGAPVTFQITSGAAAFAPLNLRRLAAVRGNRALIHRATPPRQSVTVPTLTDGIATAPVLTAGPQVGQIGVTASVNDAPAAKRALFTLSAISIAPTAPSITNLFNGDGHVTVGFSGGSDGTSPITSYQVTATDLSHPETPPASATGPGSPIAVSGLINGDTYVFTVTATSADGTSPPSAPSGRLNVGVPPVVVSGPGNGTVGKPYSSGFTVTGAPPPTVTQVSGDLPPGLTLNGDGTLTGTPTQAGTYIFTVQATSPVGIYTATVTVMISPATLGAAPPQPTGRHVSATTCTSAPNGAPSACAGATLIGSFSPLATNATATLARGAVTYAAGHATARYRKLTLHRRRKIRPGRYTLILRSAHHVIIVPVSIR